MEEGDVSHDDATAEPAPAAADPAPPRRRFRRTAIGLTLALVVAGGAGAAWWYEVPDRLFGPDPATEPAEVAPPVGLELPELPQPSRVARTAPSGGSSADAVRAALAGLDGVRRLGKRVSVEVADLEGESLYRSGVSAVTPASTLKLLGAAAALHELGADHRFATTVVRGGNRVVLVGGGDPLLTRAPTEDDAYPAEADLVTLARTTARALEADGVTSVRLGYDTSLFTGPTVNPTWEPTYIPEDVVSPIVPLWVDEGREVDGFTPRVADPARFAAGIFTAALRRAGIVVRGAPEPTVARPSMTQVASVTSAPLSQIVQHTLEVSDNEAAEVLIRHVAIARGIDPSFAGGVQAMQESLAELGVRLTGARLFDGSGLSRDNLLATETLIDVLRVAASDERLRTVITGLPVAGFTGSLVTRFLVTPPVALGEARVKTGTLTGVHSYAGIVVTADDRVLAFAALTDRVRVENGGFAREQLDRMAAALAACICAR